MILSHGRSPDCRTWARSRVEVTRRRASLQSAQTDGGLPVGRVISSRPQSTQCASRDVRRVRRGEPMPAARRSDRLPLSYSILSSRDLAARHSGHRFVTVPAPMSNERPQSTQVMGSRTSGGVAATSGFRTTTKSVWDASGSARRTALDDLGHASPASGRSALPPACDGAAHFEEVFLMPSGRPWTVRTWTSWPT